MGVGGLCRGGLPGEEGEDGEAEKKAVGSRLDSVGGLAGEQKIGGEEAEGVEGVASDNRKMLRASSIPAISGNLHCGCRRQRDRTRFRR